MASSEEITVTRGPYGIPRVSAKTALGVAYGVGWCQAEDRLEQIFVNYAKARGIMASHFGAEWIAHDVRQRIARHWETARATVQESIAPETLTEIEAYQDGIRAYMRERPDSVPASVFPLEPAYTVALAQYIIYGWPMAQVYEKLGVQAPREDFLFSNQWALSPSRTADGRAVLCIDPHLPWKDEYRFHEAGTEVGSDRRYGFFPVGLPYVGLGHNAHVAWSCTTGGPDTADVYHIKRHLDDPLLYEYEGTWRKMTEETFEIEVAPSDETPNAAPRIERRTYRRTHHGPILAENERTAYAAKTAYDGRGGVIEQFRLMNLAQNLAEFQETMALCEMMPQNIMAADREGNIWYCRTGRVPIRPGGFDWSRAVPGNISQTEWKGVHSQADLVQLLNPAEGTMQNCNTSPDWTVREGAPNADDYPAYIFNGSGRLNPRGERALQLLSEAKNVDLTQAIAIVNDTFVIQSPLWKGILRTATRKARERVRENRLDEAIRAILDWDGYTEIDSAGATLFRAWMEAAHDLRTHLAPLRDPQAELDTPTARYILDALALAKERLIQQHGSWSVPWGKEHRVERGGQSFPLAGGQWRGPLGGFITLRTIHNGQPLDENGHRVAHHGQSHVMLVFLGPEGVESHSVTPFGNSDRPESPHFIDQTRELFAKKRLKPTYFDRAIPGNGVVSKIPFER